MFNQKIDTSKLECIFTTPAGGKEYYIKELDVTVVEYNHSKQRIFFDRKSNMNNSPCRFTKCQYFGYSDSLSDGTIREI